MDCRVKPGNDIWTRPQPHMRVTGVLIIVVASGAGALSCREHDYDYLRCLDRSEARFRWKAGIDQVQVDVVTRRNERCPSLVSLLDIPLGDLRPMGVLRRASPPQFHR